MHEDGDHSDTFVLQKTADPGSLSASRLHAENLGRPWGFGQP
jgi:hypothetical protein